VRNLQFYEQQPPAKADPARPRKYLSTANGPPPPGLTQGGRKPGPAKVRQWARQVRFEQRHGDSVGSDDDEDAAQALWEQVSFWRAHADTPAGLNPNFHPDALRSIQLSASVGSLEPISSSQCCACSHNASAQCSKPSARAHGRRSGSRGTMHTSTS